MQYDSKESTAPLTLVIRFLLSLGRFCPKKVSSLLPKDIRKDYPSQRARGGAWEFRSHKGCKREGSSDGVRAAVRTGFALTPTPPASPAGLINPEFHGPRGAEPPCRLHRVKAMALSRGTQAACRSSNEHVEGPQAGRQGLCSQPLPGCRSPVWPQPNCSRCLVTGSISES